MLTEIQQVKTIDKADEVLQKISRRVKKVEDQYLVMRYRMCSGGGLTYIDDSLGAFKVNEFVGKMSAIVTGPAGAGQSRRIVSNTTTRIYIDPATPFDTVPTSFMRYCVYDANENYRGLIMTDVVISGGSLTIKLPPDKEFRDSKSYIAIAVKE